MENIKQNDKNQNMIENIELFLNNFDDFLDVCLELNGAGDGFDFIRKKKKEIKLKALNKKITLKEFHKQEAIIFYEYLKYVGVV